MSITKPRRQSKYSNLFALISYAIPSILKTYKAATMTMMYS